MTIHSELAFGLSRSDLQPIISAATHEDVDAFEIEDRHAVADGYGGDKHVVDVRFRTRSGGVGTKTLFVKQNRGLEEHHYRFLSGRVPLPQVYGAAHATDGREVLFLEHLERVGVNWNSEAEVRELLTAMALLNAVEVPDDYAARLPRWLASGPNRWIETVAALWSRADTGELGDEIAAVCRADAAAAVEHMAVRTARQVQPMQTGLVHWDLIAKNAGWRANPRELVLFDLDDVGLAPQFSDAALWLGRPDATRPLAHLRVELAAHYLAAFEDVSGRSCDLPDFLEQTSALWAARELDSLPWFVARSLDGAVAWTSDIDEGRRVYRRWLLERVTDLITVACTDEARKP